MTNLNRNTDNTSLWGSMGFSGGAYNPTEAFTNLFNTGGPMDQIWKSGVNKNQNAVDLYYSLAKSKTNQNMDALGSGFGNGMYSGAFVKQAEAMNSDNYLKAQGQGMDNLYSMTNPLMQQAANQIPGAEYNMWNPDWVNPTIVPKYDQGSQTPDWQKWLGAGVSVLGSILPFLFL
jgi:hypothetical protein